MKILLISYDNDNRIAYFPLGLGYIASALRNAGHDVKIYQQDIYHYEKSHLTKFLNENNFQAVGVGACGGYYQYRVMKENIQSILKADKRMLLWGGGHLPSPDPEFFLREFKLDFVVVGEGEETVVELLNEYEKQNSDFSLVKGIAYLDNDNFIQTERRLPINDVDAIAWPAYDLFEMEHYVLYPQPNMSSKDRVMVMLSGRGCPFKCNFCYRMEEGFRPRKTEKIIDEIKFLKDKYKITYISFWDELLMSSINRVKEFCQALIDSKVNIKWYCQGRLNYASKDIDMLYLMKKAGCVFINYGIESMDDKCLKLMNKNLTTKMIIKGIENTEKAGISPGLNIIFGNLGENRAVIEKDVEFLLKYDDQCQVRTIRPVTPYPGTDLYKVAVEKGLLGGVKDFYENKHTNSDLLTCNFTEMSDDEFYSCLHWANSILLNNYINKTKEKNEQVLYDLYMNKNSNFRGFRQV